MTSLIAAALFFIVLHVGVAGTMLRDASVGAIGERGFSLAFSLLSVAGMVWLVFAYNAADTVVLWGQSNTWKLIADVLMLPAFLLVVIGLTTRNPTEVGQERAAADPPRGIVTVTRHPFLMGVALWAFLHLVANGDAASAILFGTFLVVALLGAPSIDAKRRRKLGPAAWDAFARQTSIVPFAAIAGGRARLDTAGVGAWRPLVGLLAYALFIGGHRHIVGVSPFPLW